MTTDDEKTPLPAPPPTPFDNDEPTRPGPNVEWIAIVDRVPCRECGAQPGHYCIDPSLPLDATFVHPARQEDAQEEFERVAEKTKANLLKRFPRG